ncbi:MAG: serine/threonine protein kinase [Stigonema ocellatum SAG 48.90 = DSM 106950]|nr:serine/threonine protein kinase [Stigonema ocellatum SAG 48.90 = DSM 106950]
MLGQLVDGRYRIVQVLGSGGFGQTYVAEDTKLYNTRCVVKQFKPLATDPVTLQVARRLFDSEAQQLHKLGTHDQIPQLLAHFEENQEFFLVQQFIEGHTLSHELTPGKRLSEGYTITLLQNILQPLAFVHEHNVIHRDIKPPNLIRRKSDGKVVLIDFGAVKQIGTQVVNAQGETKMTVAIGTLGYMPSEQSRGSPRLSSDIYAVGIIGIQALTGLMADQMQEDVQTAEIIWRQLIQVNPNLADVLDRMVRYDFRQRYQSAAEALAVVQQLRNSYVPPQQSATPPQYTATPPPPVPPQYRQEIPDPTPQSSPAAVSAPASAQRPQVGWHLWLEWVFVNIVGMIVGFVLAAIIYGAGGRLFFGCGFGLMVGLLQWGSLRQRVPLSGQRWVLATTLGFSIIPFVSGRNTFSVLLIGPTVGILQWLILRQLVYRAGWWVLVNALGGCVDGGIISGAVLVWLLRKPKSPSNG